MFNPDQADKISESLSAIWLLVNTQPLSEAAIDIFIDDVANIPFDAVMSAMANARRQCKGRISVSDIMRQIEMMDGRPSTEEAWGIAVQSQDERLTVVWTQEASTAWYEVASGLMDAGDKFNAARGFKDKYERLVADSRANSIPVKWLVNQGWDKDHRLQMIELAKSKNQLTSDYASMLLTHHLEPDNSLLGIVAGCIGFLENDQKKHEASAEVRNEHLQKMRDVLALGKIKPKIAHVKRDGWATYNEAEEMGLFVSNAEQSQWAELAASGGDMRELQIRIFDKKATSND